jgi:antirestriction protein ArdC
MTDKKNAYEIVAENIIKQLENGVAPWRKEWLSLGYRPLSLSSRKKYNGVNFMLLTMEAMDKGYESPWWGTYKQIEAMGGKVMKGEKGTPVVLWKRFETKDSTTETPKFAAIMRYFTVFSAQQAEWEGEAPKYEKAEARTDVEIVESAQALMDNYFAKEGAPSLNFGGGRAFYSPSADGITLPEQNTFFNDAAFYSTAFHEMGHSTGHKTRLNRDGVVEGHYFGSELYSEEELVAEFTAAFLSGQTGVLPATLENSAAYIKSWHRRLKEDPKMLVKAIGRAQKAANYITDEAEGEGEGE